MNNIKDIQSAGINLLTDLIHTNNNIIIKIPKQFETSKFIEYPFKALISKVELKDISSNPSLTIDTLICKLNIDRLIGNNMPTSNYKSAIIKYNKTDYTVSNDSLDSFENEIILYLNKKG